MAAPIAGLLQDTRVREAFPVLKDVVYLNIGTYGIMPDPALAKFIELQSVFERRGVAAGHDFYLKMDGTRERIANLIGAEKDEVAFTRNATDGINLVLAGIDWQPGDEVITTDQEHEAMNHPLLYLQKTKGLKVVRVEVSPSAEVMLARLAAAATDKTRLVAVSFVTCETGTRLPVQAMCQWAAERGIRVLLDGAQVSGAIKINVRDIGCDFYTSNGHKWLSGPKGTGFFYGRRDRLTELSPAHVGAGSLEKVDLVTGEVEAFHTAQRFEFGTRAWGLQAGLGCSLDWFESIGWDNVYSHIAALSGYLKAAILDRPYLKLLTPISYEESSGLVAFVFKDRNCQDISTELREKYKIHTRVVPHFNDVRISTGHFNNTDDIDTLIHALDHIAD